MKLARKLTLAIIASILAVMSVTAVIRVERERELFARDIERDHQFIGRALRDALVPVALSEGIARADFMLGAINAHDPQIRIRIVSLDPNAPPARRTNLSREALQPLVDGGEMAISDQLWFTTYVPMRISSGTPMALEVRESLGEQKRYIHSSVLNNLLSLCAIVFVCSVLAIVLGYAMVGRPMSRLTVKARRIGEGDLSGPLVFQQNDEIAEFAVEMNAMCDRLAEAHDRVEHATLEKIQALEQLRHADRLTTVGQLASGLAHELGTPLNVVLGRARMILEGDATPEELSENARIISDQATKMAALIRQLLDFARPRGPNLQALDLRGIAEQTIDMLGPLAEKKKIRLTMEKESEPLCADADPMQIQQALTNLVVNAIQAMPRGGQVVLEAGNRVVRPPADHAGEEQEYRYLSVIDEGEGIEEGHLTHIFEPFFSTKGVGEGTGLGLSITYGIVRDHHGWIQVDSKPGAGSTFTIFLPEHRAESLASPMRPRISSSMFATNHKAAAPPK